MSGNKTPFEKSAIAMAGGIVAAYVRNHDVKKEELPGLLHDVYAAVQQAGEEERKVQASRSPAVPVSKSVTPDYVICLEDGKKLKMLKRYLRTHFNLSTDEYRRKWGLPADYPMVAPNYAKRRSRLAKKIGLGKASSTTAQSGKAKKSRTLRKKSAA